MSYLLTEIALEMLGYKYYNTNGEFARTNFQLKTPTVSNDGWEKSLTANLGIDFNTLEPLKERSSPNESNDRTVNIDLSTDGNEVVKDASITGDGAITHPVNSIGQINGNFDENNGTNSTDSNTDISESSAIADPEHPTYLGKLMKREIFKIKSQLERNNKHYLHSNKMTAKRIEQRGGISAEEFLRPYFKQEKENLRQELKNLWSVRKKFESDIAKFNPSVYEKYTMLRKEGSENSDMSSTKK